MPLPMSTWAPRAVVPTVEKSKSNTATRFLRPCAAGGAPPGAAAATAARAGGWAFASGPKKPATINASQRIFVMENLPVAELSEEYGKTAHQWQNLTATLWQVSTMARNCPTRIASKGGQNRHDGWELARIGNLGVLFAA